MKNEWIIPDAIVVGFSRTRTLQFKCKVCGKLYFPDIEEKPVCEDCKIEEIQNPVYGTDGEINIIGWDQRVGVGSKNRSMRNFKRVFKRDSYQCQYCGYKPRSKDYIPLHIDHIFPHVSGGNNEMSNLVVACMDCNLIATDNIFTDFVYKKNFILSKRLKKGMKIYNPNLCPFDWLESDVSKLGLENITLLTQRKNKLLENRKYQEIQRVCLWCKLGFETRHNYGHKYCSQKCTKEAKAHRAELRLNKAEIDKKNRIADNRLKSKEKFYVFLKTENLFVDDLKKQLMFWYNRFDRPVRFELLWTCMREVGYHLHNSWKVPCKQYLRDHEPDSLKYFKDVN